MKQRQLSVNYNYSLNLSPHMPSNIYIIQWDTGLDEHKIKTRSKIISIMFKWCAIVAVLEALCN